MATLENTTIKVESVAEIQDAVRSHDRVEVGGGGSKPVLSTQHTDAALLDLAALRGVTVYDPGEFTFTARAGTPLSEVQVMLAEKGQYLPFDPPLAEDGATLGGTVAAGLSGPGRLRYGGVRDFLIGVRFVDGRGEEVRGGGNVVKNAAGFDFPKLMVG
ncbi:MAG: FAD-binding protein, partial [Caldilineaceae bacterium]|nr:FAD-binding protein [Caldilineaceae bacterium]